eukprot:10439117-Heterocapsa_arctica.AAC.1
MARPRGSVARDLETKPKVAPRPERPSRVAPPRPEAKHRGRDLPPAQEASPRPEAQRRRRGPSPRPAE